MARTAAPARQATIPGGVGTWRLTGVTPAHGAGCTACGRELRARVFEVAHPDHGVTTMGRRCAARATGYPTTRLEHLERSARRVAEMRRRDAVLFAELPEAGILVERLEQAGRDLKADGRDPEAAWYAFTSHEKTLLHAVRTALTTDSMWSAYEGGEPNASCWEYLAACGWR